MELKGTYEGDQDPLERLRNKLTPFLTLAHIVANENVIKSGKFHDLAESSAKTANGYEKDIRIYLDDLEGLLRRYRVLFDKEWARRERIERSHMAAGGEEIEWAEAEYFERMDEQEEDDRLDALTDVDHDRDLDDIDEADQECNERNMDPDYDRDLDDIES